MNFLIELGFYLCTFNLKILESIHSSLDYFRQAESLETSYIRITEKHNSHFIHMKTET